MEGKKIAVDFVEWIMKIQNSDSWFKHTNGVWFKHMVGHMNTDELFDYYIESKGDQANSEPANCAIFDVSASTVIKQLHDALTNLLKAVDDEGWHNEGKDYEEQSEARKALSNTPEEYLR